MNRKYGVKLTMEFDSTQIPEGFLDELLAAQKAGEPVELTLMQDVRFFVRRVEHKDLTERFNVELVPTLDSHE